MRTALRTAGRFCLFFVFVLAIMTAMASLAHAAGTNDAATAAAPPQIGGKDTSLCDYYWLGGIFMHPILLCSIIAVYLVVDVILLTRIKKMIPPDVVPKLKELLLAKKVDEAIAVCEATPSLMTRILAAGLDAYPRGKTALEETLADHDVREAGSIRLRVAYLNTVATIAPMLGLLGTVSGMIKAFANVGTLGMQASALAANIAEALITTYGGLVVAIPAMVLFFFYRNLVNDRMVVVEDCIGDLVLALEQQPEKR